MMMGMLSYREVRLREDTDVEDCSLLKARKNGGREQFECFHVTLVER